MGSRANHDRRRTKDGFRTEASLQRTLSRLHWPSVLAAAGIGSDLAPSVLALRREVTVGGRVADLVVVKVTGDVGDQPTLMRPRFDHAFITWHLRRDGAMTVRELAERPFAGEQSIEPQVEAVLGAGFS